MITSRDSVQLVLQRVCVCVSSKCDPGDNHFCRNNLRVFNTLAGVNNLVQILSPTSAESSHETLPARSWDQHERQVCTSTSDEWVEVGGLGSRGRARHSVSIFTEVSPELILIASHVFSPDQTEGQDWILLSWRRNTLGFHRLTGIPAGVSSRLKIISSYHLFLLLNYSIRITGGLHVNSCLLSTR